MSGSCDAHVHLWPATTPYPDRVVVPGFTADAATLLAAMDDAGVRRTAVVTPSAMGFDNSFTLTAVRSAPDRLVAIGRLDLDAPDADVTLRREADAGLAGVRIGPDMPRELLSSTAVAVWTLAGERGLPVHLHLQPDEILRFAAVAERFPGVPLVLDHLGRPDVAAGVDASGFQAILALARHQNVWLKTPAGYWFSRSGPPYRDLVPFVAAAIARFGTDRLLWGSDWPACTRHGSYADAMEPLRSAAELQPADRSRVLGENFERLYGAARTRTRGDEK